MKRAFAYVAFALLLAVSVPPVTAQWPGRRQEDTLPVVDGLAVQTASPTHEPAATVAGSSEGTRAFPWQYELVDARHEVGQWASLALDAAGRPHISHRGWGIEYAHFDGSAWILEMPDPINVTYTSLALDRFGWPHIGYFATDSRILKHAWYDGSIWQTEVVDEGDAGHFCSLALDSAGRPRISYHKEGDRDLKYAWHDGLVWHTEVVDSAGEVGYWTSLALDAADRPHISYYDQVNLTLKHAYFDGSSWQTQTVAQVSSIGYAPTTSLKLDRWGRPHISFLDEADHEVLYAHYDGSAWQVETVYLGTSNELVRFSSLALNSLDYPSISWVSQILYGGSQVWYAWYDGSVWQVEVVHGEQTGQKNPSLVLDSSDRPHIAYNEKRYNGLVYTWVGPDDHPPAAITDLGASPGAIVGEVHLTWTAPGDNTHSGTATQYDVRYSTSKIIEGNWSFATQASGEPAPAQAGTAQSMTMQVPFPSQVYYFAIKTADEVPNWSELSNVTSTVSGQPVDTVSPGRITDLIAVTGSYTGEVDLAWTAPGDDGYTGTADLYIVRWNTDPIMSDNWGSSYDVSGEPIPSPAGSAESMTVANLAPGQPCFFAIRSYDETDNRSAVSNSSNAVAYGAPLPDLVMSALSVAPTAVNPGDYVQVNFTVRNNGASTAGVHTSTVYLGYYRYGGERVELGKRNILSLDPDSSSSFTLTARIPPGTPHGEYYVVAAADSVGNVVTESNEHNNERDQYPITVQGAVPQPDLYITGIEVSQGVQVFRLDDPDYHDPPYGDHPHPSHPTWGWEEVGPGNNDVRLVRERTTIVRVFVDVDPSVADPLEVAVALEYNTGSGWQSLTSLNSPISLRGDENDPRNYADLSVNFQIHGHRLNAAALDLRATVDPDDQIPESDEGNNTGVEQVQLQSQDQLRIGILPVSMVKDGQPVGTGEVNDDVFAYINYARAALPFPDWLDVAFLEPPYSFEYSAGSCFWGTADDNLLNELESRPRGDLDIIVGVFPRAAGDSCAAFEDLLGEAFDIGRGHSVIVRDYAASSYDTMAHELGHLVPGLKHPVWWPHQCSQACGACDFFPTWPYDGLCLQDVGTAILGFDWSWQPRQAGQVIRKACGSDFHDVMSYCQWLWVSPYSWEVWLTQSAPTAQDAFQPAAYTVVSGLVYTDNTAILNPLWISDERIAPPSKPGEYCVEALGISSTLVFSECFDLDFFDHMAGESVPADTFQITLPYSPSVDRVQLTFSGTLIAQAIASPSPPTVSLVYPDGGEILTQPFFVTWEGSDDDGDPLSYRLFYSPDSGSSWLMLASGITRTVFPIDPSNTPGSETGLFKILASDGFHSRADQSDGVCTIPRKAPVPIINPILGDLLVSLSTTVMLDGYAIDLEDGSVSTTNFAWTSSLDGPLGRGSPIDVADLSVGIHSITLIVTDTDGMTGTHSIFLAVMQDADQDGMPDPWEQDVGLDPTLSDAHADADQDGLWNVDEFHYGTDPVLADTDYDEYDDLTEILFGSDPLDPGSIAQDPIADLVALNDSPTALGGITTLSATITAGTSVRYTWSLGDETFGCGAVLSHTYPAVATYTAVVTASNPLSIVTATTVVTVEEPITALEAFNNSPTSLGGLTSLTATVVSGSNVSYNWAFGDGTLGSGATLAHTYPEARFYIATVTASNSVSVVSDTTAVTITDVPISGLVATNDSPTEMGSTTMFTATTASGTNVLYTWWFGDGGSDAGSVVTHTYYDVGTYSATVTASNGTNHLTATTVVSICEACSPPMAITFTWVPALPTAGIAVTLTGVATGTPPLTLTWSLGDGTVGSGLTVTHIYTLGATYLVVMTATGPCGEPAWVQRDVVVDSPHPAGWWIYLPLVLK